MEASRSGTSGSTDPWKKMGLDWTHPQEASQQHHQAGSDLESTGEEKEGKTQGWIGHILRKSASNITRQALTWNPQGKRKRGRARNTWRRAIVAEMSKSGHWWAELEKTAQTQVCWGSGVHGLWSSWGKMPR